MTFRITHICHRGQNCIDFMKKCLCKSKNKVLWEIRFYYLDNVTFLISDIFQAFFMPKIHQNCEI